MRNEELAIEVYDRPQLPTLRDIVSILFRQRKSMLIAFATVVVAIGVSGLWVPKYEAQMKILVRRQRSDAIVSASANAPTQISSDQVSEEDLNSEVELLNSQDLLRKVVLTTGLMGRSNSATDPDIEIRIEKAVRKLSKDLKIDPLRKTNVISLTYQSRDPQLAASVLRAVASEYTEKHLAVHRSSGEYKFFDQQTDRYQQGLLEAQKKLADFTSGTGVVSAEIERDDALRQANDFDSTARQAQTTVVETERRVQALQAELLSLQPRMTTIVRSSDNAQLFQQLKSTLLNLEIKRTELLTKYEPTYRLVQEVDQQIADAKRAISEEENKPIRDETSDQNPDFEWVRAELTKEKANLSGAKARAESAASIATQYHETAEHLDKNGVVQQDLLRDVKMQEENYLLYVHRREEARISDELDRQGILNVAMAEEPLVPALPNRTLLGAAMLTLLLAGTLSLTTAVVVDFMDTSIRTPEELAHYLGTPVLAALPKGRVQINA